jgi:saccharopine dehydrogenase-like NADP-dependent oxidoreductase
MNQPVRFGILGGYGATGRVVVAELWKSCSDEIRIGGRDLARGKALAGQFDGRVSAAEVDALDAASLDRYCSDCSIIVHCGGPVMQLQDRVAQAAWRSRCHYVDLAGLTLVKERLLPQAQEITDRGLSFVVSAGWLPGLTELLPEYALARARDSMEAVESMTVYFGDSGEWSIAAFRDMAWFLRRVGLRRPGYFHRGERVAVKMSQGSARVDLGGKVGRRWFAMQSMAEQDEIGQRFNEGDVFLYTYLPGLRAALTAALAAFLPLPNGLSARLLQRALRESSLPVGGFVVAKVQGRSQGRQVTLNSQILYDQDRGYWINGLVAATVARLIAEGKGVQPGVHFLAEAVDPIPFLAELRTAGVEQSETVEPLE